MTGTGPTRAGREAEVRLRLDRVTDPEIDEPVTELGFVTGVAVDAAGGVTIGFRLPTYWCAANFAFMMAEDMRREVAVLPWVRRVDVTLDDHVYAAEINRGLADGLGFGETFGSAAEGDLQPVRRSFSIKSFQRRQEALLRHLLAQDWTPAALVALGLDALQALALDATGEQLRARYLDRRGVAGAAGPAFVAADGTALAADALAGYLRDLARVGITADFNGVLCRGLLAARYGEAAPVGEPTLLDFARMPPREARPPDRGA